MSQTAFCSCDFRVRHNLPPIWLGKMNVFNKLRVNQELGFIADRFLGVTGKADVSKHGNRTVFLIYNGHQTECTDLDQLRYIRFEKKKLPVVLPMWPAVAFLQHQPPLLTMHKEHITKSRYGFFQMAI